MKYILLCISIILCTSSFAQNDLGKLSDINRIALSVYVPETDLPAAAQKQLTNKLNQVAARGGAAAIANSRFILTAHIDILSQDITPTAPPMHAYTLQVTFFVGDGVEGRLFFSTSTTTKGVGETETKAYLAALKNIKTNDYALQKMMEIGKEKIIEYYNSQCDFILKDAQAKADRKEFEAAISQLVAVPGVCKECYDKALDQSVIIYKRMIENDCQKNISNAQAAMAANKWDDALEYLAGYTPDMDCYSEVKGLMTQVLDHRCADALARAEGAWASRNSEEAAKWLSEVSADSKCYPDAKKLQQEIAKNLDEKDQREWNLKVKEQNDAIALEQATINALRDVGVAYGENQPSIVYDFLWW